ncbi:hypothetical protein LshimejAT787_2301010 [Lyophyllum shimeji]|uniref:Uncharacterized protein n=1 Tax=Lyophyllum shimeji TaxID=47721 RepID=A0A9P3Q2L9_LYOSH|nr:hypothetical protein LshimejAT787_2301010 [Lyophyllum shimeji]
MSDDYPSMLWVTIPPVLLVSAYFIRKWYLARRLRLYGIGKGAPGFQTNVRSVRVTPEIAARIRRGEHVSPEEIARAAAEAEKEDARGTPPPRLNSLAGRGVVEEVQLQPSDEQKEPVNEWLPESITGPKKRAKGKKR